MPYYAGQADPHSCTLSPPPPLWTTETLHHQASAIFSPEASGHVMDEGPKGDLSPLMGHLDVALLRGG